MRTVLSAFLLLIAAPAAAQTSAADSAGIRAAALDYIEGWYAADGARMERALHPDLAKRIAVSRGGTTRLESMTAAELIAGTRSGGGRATPVARRRTEVRILDVFENAASVRVDAHAWIDFMQLAKFDGSWKIVNVLWERRSAAGPRGAGQ